MVLEGMISSYQNFISGLSPQMQIFVNLLLITLMVVIYAVFIWKLHSFISLRDILPLKLSRLNKTEHPVMTKLIAGFLYFIEYIVIFPILIIFWFIFFVCLILLISDLDIGLIIMIAAVSVAALRIMAYIPKYGEDLAADIVVEISVTLLIISATAPTFFRFDVIFGRIAQIPLIFSQIKYFIYFILFIEVLLRVIVFFSSAFKEKKETAPKKNNLKNK